ncbi:MAG: hypothetical protein K0Q53_479 [Massilibacillus sp.]|jgi:uncharacterized protein YbbK (DUF523 family)|nr:hypothetical protein [Massilibacillus sp.]
MILVSACLVGHKVRYNGGADAHELLMKYNQKGNFIAICPECLGKLPIPRPPAEIINGSGQEVLAGTAKIMSKLADDVTMNFVTGAETLLTIAVQYGVKAAILKERSPSCGVHQIYDGTFSGTKIVGQGVAAALLSQRGIKLYSEEDITEQMLKDLGAAETNEG